MTDSYKQALIWLRDNFWNDTGIVEWEQVSGTTLNPTWDSEEPIVEFNISGPGDYSYDFPASVYVALLNEAKRRYNKDNTEKVNYIDCRIEVAYCAFEEQGKYRVHHSGEQKSHRGCTYREQNELDEQYHTYSDRNGIDTSTGEPIYVTSVPKHFNDPMTISGYRDINARGSFKEQKGVYSFDQSTGQGTVIYNVVPDLICTYGTNKGMAKDPIPRTTANTTDGGSGSYFRSSRTLGWNNRRIIHGGGYNKNLLPFVDSSDKQRVIQTTDQLFGPTNFNYGYDTTAGKIISKGTQTGYPFQDNREVEPDTHGGGYLSGDFNAILPHLAYNYWDRDAKRLLYALVFNVYVNINTKGSKLLCSVYGCPRAIDMPQNFDWDTFINQTRVARYQFAMRADVRGASGTQWQFRLPKIDNYTYSLNNINKVVGYDFTSKTLKELTPTEIWYNSGTQHYYLYATEPSGADFRAADDNFVIELTKLPLNQKKPNGNA